MALAAVQSAESASTTSVSNEAAELSILEADTGAFLFFFLLTISVSLARFLSHASKIPVVRSEFWVIVLCYEQNPCRSLILCSRVESIR